MSEQRQPRSHKSQLAKRLFNQCDRCTLKLKRTFVITRAHMYDTISCTATSERCAEFQLPPGESAIISACLIVWQAYVRIQCGANIPGREGCREKRETEREREQRGWMKREEEEGLEHPLCKNRK